MRQPGSHAWQWQQAEPRTPRHSRGDDGKGDHADVDLAPASQTGQEGERPRLADVITVHGDGSRALHRVVG